MTTTPPPSSSTPPPAGARGAPPPADGPLSASRRVTLPTGRLLAAAVVPCVVVALAWMGIAALLGWPRPRVVAGPAGAGWVALVGVAGVLALTPWNPRSLGTWPLVWTAAGFVRLLAALGGGLLLYSRPPFGGAFVFAPVTVAYLAVMAVETREYARAMGRLQATDAGPDPADDDRVKTHSSE